jgi:(E)-4-hydroxy-3-methylbut-2-enyl-diphosphate synthase
MRLSVAYRGNRSRRGAFALTKSAIGIGALLLDGIGDTIRVSLTAPPIEEIYAGLDILRALKLRRDSVEIISCPTCGRTEYDVIGISAALRDAVKNIKKPLKIAVMGCIVNGIGEALMPISVLPEDMANQLFLKRSKIVFGI